MPTESLQGENTNLRQARRKMARCTLQVLMSLSLILFAAGPLVACKDTDKLTTRILNEESENIDYDNPLKNWVDVSNAPERQDTARVLSELEAKNMLEQTKSTFDQDTDEDNGESKRRETNDEANNDADASESNDRANGKGKASARGSQGEDQGDAGEGSGSVGEGDGAGGSNTNTSGTGGAGDEGSDGSKGGEDEAGSLPGDEQLQNLDNSAGKGGGTGGKNAKVYNDGTYQELPQDVATVAATGDYALIVCMLAGGDKNHKSPLVASDQEFLSSTAMDVFSKEGVSAKTVKKAWKNDGTKKGEVNLSVLKKTKPDTVLVGTDDTSLTQQDADELMEAGISVVVMPRMGKTTALDWQIEKAVSVVGELLKDADTAQDTLSMAKRFREMHDNVLAATVRANGGYTPGWNIASPTGTPYLRILYGTMQLKADGTLLGTADEISANWANTVYVDAWADYSGAGKVVAKRPIDSTTNKIEYYYMDVSDGFGVMSELVETGKETDFFTYIADYGSLLYYYLKCGGADDHAYLNLSEEYGRAFAVGEGSVDSDMSISKFTISSGEKAEIVHSGNSFFRCWTWGLGRDREWHVIEHPSNVNIEQSDAEYLPGPSVDGSYLLGTSYFPGIVVRSAWMAEKICSSAAKRDGAWHNERDYDVWVLPEGVAGSWSESSPESYLAAPWAFCTFRNGADYSQLQGYVQEFYQTFYRARYQDYVKGFGQTYHARCS